MANSCLKPKECENTDPEQRAKDLCYSAFMSLIMRTFPVMTMIFGVRESIK